MTESPRTPEPGLLRVGQRWRGQKAAGSPHSPVQVVARSPRGPLGRGGGVLGEPDEAKPHAVLRRPGPLAGGGGGCRFRAGHGRTAREKGQQQTRQRDTELARPPELKSPAGPPLDEPTIPAERGRLIQLGVAKASGKADLG